MKRISAAGARAGGGQVWTANYKGQSEQEDGYDKQRKFFLSDQETGI